VNVTTARELTVAPGVTAATRNPVASWLLVFLTLGIGGVVWIYVVNRELRDYSMAIGRPFGNSPVAAAILAALWPLAFIPTLIAVWLTARRVRTAQQWTGTPGRVHPVLATLLVFALFAHVWYLQHALNGAWEAAASGAEPGEDYTEASGTAQQIATQTRSDADHQSSRYR
jgi:hypothetical protein